MQGERQHTLVVHPCCQFVWPSQSLRGQRRRSCPAAGDPAATQDRNQNILVALELVEILHQMLAKAFPLCHFGYNISNQNKSLLATSWLRFKMSSSNNGWSFHDKPCVAILHLSLSGILKALVENQFWGPDMPSILYTQFYWLIAVTPRVHVDNANDQKKPHLTACLFGHIYAPEPDTHQANLSTRYPALHR